MILKVNHRSQILSALFILVFVNCAFTLKAQSDTILFSYQKPLFDFDYQKPLFKLGVQQKANKNMSLRYSVFTGYREGVDPVKRDFGFNMATSFEENGMVRQNIYNTSVVEMLTHGFIDNGLPSPLPSHIIIEAKDPSQYMYRVSYGDKKQWMRKNTHCYELMMPLSAFRSAGAVKYIEQDIIKHFGISWKEEKRKVKALVLVRITNEDKLKSKATGPVLTGENGLFSNAGLGYLGLQIEKAGGAFPFVDETGYEGGVDMDLGAISYNDLPALRKALQHYGLDLKEEVRELAMYVLKEIK